MLVYVCILCGVACVCVYPGMYIYTHTYTDQRRKVSIISPYTTLQLFVLGGRFSLLLIQKLSILAKQACPLAPRVYLSLFSILELFNMWVIQTQVLLLGEQVFLPTELPPRSLQRYTILVDDKY